MTLKAHEFLERGIGHMVDRAKAYDKPDGERSMGKTVAAFSAITGIEISEAQGWMFMALLKLVRSQQGEFKADNYEDGAAYVGLMGEASSHQIPEDEPDYWAGIEWPEWANWRSIDPEGS